MKSGVLIAALLAAAVWAQTPSQAPTFRGRVDLVPLDVSVWDKDHNPVKGLTADKFTLLEDNKPREIVTFAAVDIPDSPPPTAAWMRDAAKDVETNDVTDKRLFMILVDDASFGDLTLFPSQVEKIKETARTVIRHLGSSDLAAVFFTGDNRRSQEFTADHSRLLAAVNGMTGVTLGKIPGCDLAAVYSVTVTERAVEALLGSPGRRKALVDIQYDRSTLDRTPWHTLASGGGPRGPALDCGPFLIGSTESMFEKAQRAGVNVYTMVPGHQVDPNYWEDTWFRRVAHETGGEAFGDVLDPKAAEHAVARIFQANSSYYVLGYSSAELKNFHTIQVKVDLPGIEVRTRDKYYWPDPEKPPPSGPPPPPLLTSIAGAMPDSAVPMWTAPMVFASPNLSSAIIAIPTRVHLTPPAGASPSAVLETFDLATRLFTAEGVARGSVATQGSARVAGQGVEVEVFSEIAAPKPGLYELRLAVHRAAANLDGSVYSTIDVPDFAHLPVSLSGVVVGTTQWPSFGPRDGLAALLPAPPTTEREFGRGDRVRAYVRVYEGGSSKPMAVDVHVRIIDEHDNAVIDRTDSLTPERFGSSRTADVRVDLPTSTIAPGQYLLTFETALGKTTARREVRFSVR